jgi:murein DD-endopeptidase MepM/ murein hydrolase activator NlpD
VDVGRLRAETRRQAEALERVGGELAALETEMERLAEFERRVRVIADLPSRLVETDVPEVAAGGEGSSPEATGPAEGAGGARDAPTGGQGGGGPDEPATAGDPSDPLARLRVRAVALAGAVAPRAESLDALARSLERERARLAALPTIWPTEGWVTSGFGYRTSPFTGRRQFHSGLDIAADFGTPIVAPARARVVFVGRKGPLGRAVVLDHGHGLRTTYGHTSEIYVERGQTVERGARIAAVGSSGRSTGPHLHYGVSRERRAVDPRDFVIE